MGSYENSVVLITGCSSGIGRALAVEFSSRGHRVFATARSRESIDDLSSETTRTAVLDVTDGPSITDAVEECMAWVGRVDLVVNNAGYALIGPGAELDIDDLRTQFETNVVGLVSVSQAVIPAMVKASRGRIVNIGSVSGLTTSVWRRVQRHQGCRPHAVGLDADGVGAFRHRGDHGATRVNQVVVWYSGRCRCRSIPGELALQRCRRPDSRARGDVPEKPNTGRRFCCQSRGRGNLPTPAGSDSGR